MRINKIQPMAFQAARINIVANSDNHGNVASMDSVYNTICVNKDRIFQKSDEDSTNDSFVVEHFPINRSYGCCINRGSNVTIVSPSGVTEIGVSWYAYYLAKLGIA